MDRVLIIAPHADDEVLGVGGTICKHVAQGDEVWVCVVTAPDASLFDAGLKQMIRNEAKAAHDILGVSRTIYLDLPAVKLDQIPKHEINAAVGGVVMQGDPTVVYLPHRGDMHFDHREVFDAALVALRPNQHLSARTICAYETLSETEWGEPSSARAFIPNHFVDITSHIDRKEAAFAMFRSQARAFPHPRSVTAIRALSAVRGGTIGVTNAEAFMTVRSLWR